MESHPSPIGIGMSSMSLLFGIISIGFGGTRVIRCRRKVTFRIRDRRQDTVGGAKISHKNKVRLV